MRGNDGVKLQSGEYLYGTMYDNPNIGTGLLYCLSNNLELSIYDAELAIPNTFIELDDKILISDSMKKVVYEFPIDKYLTSDKKVWCRFDSGDVTPDGGCISENGYIHLCLWGASAVVVLDKSGKIQNKINVPALNPSNCCIINGRWLIVTSAYEDHTCEQLVEFPLSGHTFKIDLGDNYEY